MRTFKQKLNNLGLEYFESPTELSLLTNSDEISNQKGSDTNDSEQHQQQQQVLIDEYQSLITESLIKTDFKSQLSLTLKLRQIKKVSKKLVLPTIKTLRHLKSMQKLKLFLN